MRSSYVIKPDELSALNYLRSSHPRPAAAQWINRGTDRPLRKQSVDLLLRTLFSDAPSASVLKLQQSSGLRVEFESESERMKFAQDLSTAKAVEHESWSNRITMMFSDKSGASAAAEDLLASGVPEHAVSILWRAGRFMDVDLEWIQGHSLMAVAGVTAGGSLAGMAVGAALFAVPGVGQVAAVGGLAASAGGAAPAITGIFGATVAAIAKMLTDTDVEDVARKRFIERRKSSPVFVSVDFGRISFAPEQASAILTRHGGRLVKKDTK